jgi:hypothetical protein
VKDTFDLIKQSVISSKIKKYTVKDVADNSVLEYKRFDGGAKGIYEFTIKSIAPDSSILRRIDFRDSFMKNDYSIGVIVNLGELNVLFSGDIENKTINKMPDYYFPEHIDLIKVPHHCSNSSDKLLSRLDSENRCDISTFIGKYCIWSEDELKTYCIFKQANCN